MPKNKPTSPVTPQERHAAERIGGFLTLGILLLLIGGAFLGGALANNAWADPAPSDSSYDSLYYDDEDEDEGDGSGAEFAFLLGAAMVTAGQIYVLIGCIGHGVALGVARAGHQPPRLT